jgi:hypothetical protein
MEVYGSRGSASKPHRLSSQSRNHNADVRGAAEEAAEKVLSPPHCHLSEKRALKTKPVSQR